MTSSPDRRGIDFLATVTAPDGRQSQVAIEVKTSVLAPSETARVVERFSRQAGPGVVIADFISPESRRRLRSQQISYVDATGNVSLLLEAPALYVSKEGALRDPARDRGAKRSLKGPAAARIVRALTDRAEPIGVRSLAERADTTPGYVSKILELLAADDLVTRTSGSRGGVAKVAWRRLIERWADDYSFVASNQVTSYLDPRGLPALRQRLESATFRRALTGSFVATEIAPVVSPGSLACFVDDPALVARELGLRPADSGGNVILAAPFDPVVFERPWRASPLPMAALPQVAVDLLTSPGRGPAEAEALLDWMEQNEHGWRT
ncbi:MAG: hypothetical protein NVSMB8_06480 [Candidatus Limnocylindrales bacterium]